MEPMPDLARLPQRLRESLKVALKSPPPTGGIIGNVHLGVGAGEVARRNLSAHDVVEVVRAEIGERTVAAAEYERLGQAEQTTRLKAEAMVLEVFLETALREP
jgi:uncharacterized protein YqeY